MPDHPDSILEQRRKTLGVGYITPSEAAGEVPLADAENKLLSLYWCAIKWMELAESWRSDLTHAEAERDALRKELDELKGGA